MPPLCARRLPRWYGERMRRKVQAGAGVESLRARCAWFYDVAQRLHALEGAPPDVGPFAAATFRARYRVRACPGSMGTWSDPCTSRRVWCPCCSVLDGVQWSAGFSR